MDLTVQLLSKSATPLTSMVLVDTAKLASKLAPKRFVTKLASNTPMSSRYIRSLLVAFFSLLIAGLFVGCATPQIHAFVGNSKEVNDYLTKPHANVNNANSVGDTMLHSAVWGQKSEIVKLLLEKGANPNLLSNNGSSPLLLAVLKNDLDIARLLLNSGADPSLFLPKQGSALVAAVDTNQEQMVDLLLAYKPNLNLKNEKEATALTLSIASTNLSRRNLGIAKKIIDAGADLNLITQGVTPLTLSIDLGISGISELLIDKNADVNLPNSARSYPLHVATFKLDINVVRKLLDKKANVNVKDKTNSTPLMFAAMKSSLDISKLLIAAGADVNSVNDFGATALSYAAKEGYTDLVKYLLDKKANPSLGSSENSPLGMAKKFNRFEIVSILEKSIGIKSPAPYEGAGRQGLIADGLKLSATGTGFRVAPNGVIVTNAHVVEGCRDIRINNTSNPLIAIDSVNDLAIIKGPAGHAVTVRSANSVKVGESVVVVGFPLSRLLGSGIQANTGDVSALSGISNDSRVFQISAPVNSGNSGGPLFDNRGNLIGVVQSKLSAAKMLKAMGDIPQNVNFAIKSNVLTSFLNVHGVSYKSNQSDKQRNVVDVVESARETTYSIECWN